MSFLSTIFDWIVDLKNVMQNAYYNVNKFLGLSDKRARENFEKALAFWPPAMLPIALEKARDYLNENPDKRDTLALITSTFNPIAQSAAFAQFFLEEAMQTIMFSLMGAVNLEDMTVARVILDNGYKIQEFAEKVNSLLYDVNPMFGEIYKQFFKASRLMLDNFSAQIEQNEALNFGGGVWLELRDLKNKYENDLLEMKLRHKKEADDLKIKKKEDMNKLKQLKKSNKWTTEYYDNQKILLEKDYDEQERELYSKQKNELLTLKRNFEDDKNKAKGKIFNIEIPASKPAPEYTGKPVGYVMPPDELGSLTIVGGITKNTPYKELNDLNAEYMTGTMDDADYWKRWYELYNVYGPPFAQYYPVTSPPSSAPEIPSALGKQKPDIEDYYKAPNAPDGRAGLTVLTEPTGANVWIYNFNTGQYDLLPQRSPAYAYARVGKNYLKITKAGYETVTDEFDLGVEGATMFYSLTKKEV